MPVVWHIVAACANPDYIRLYHREDKAPSLDWTAIGELEHLGPTLIDRGTNFGVYSASATAVDVLLFDDPESTQPTAQFALTRYGDVFNVYVEGVGPGQHYGIIAWGPNWEVEGSFLPGTVNGFRADVDEGGHRMNPNKLLIDPYAKALHRDHDWTRGSAASGEYRAETTWSAAAKSVVVAPAYTWSDHETAWQAERAAGGGHQDLVVYEVHVKGFSMDASSSALGVEHFGSFRGVGEGAAYFGDLGVTAVELLPVHEKGLDGGYWGYNNLSWFANELSMSASWQGGDEPVTQVEEFQEMVDKLHQAGVEVILDVVYNHTGEGGLYRTKLYYDDPDGDFLCDPAAAANLDSQEVANLLSWRGLDSSSYYELENAKQGFWDGSTGVGNQVRANHVPARRQILDSLRYAVTELHVDGFRFDLAAVLGEPDGAPSQYWTSAEGTLLQEIADDPVLLAHGTRLIAEPWSVAYDASQNYPASLVAEGVGFAEWNANFRDTVRTFLNDDFSALNTRQGAIDLGGAMTGSFDRYAGNGRRPYHSLNFVTAHDGFTMFDLFAFEEKQNGCGPLNSVCCEDACSAWCDPTSGESNNHSRSWTEEWEKRRQMRNAFALLFLSRGTPMLLGGDEWMRTQYGNNNAYSTWADNAWNWFRWGEWTSENANNQYRHRMHDYVRGLIALRKAHPGAFAVEDWDGGMPMTWWDPAGHAADGTTWGGRAIAVDYGATAEHPRRLRILINGDAGIRTFSLPQDHAWDVVVDTQSYYDLPGTGLEPTGWFVDAPDADPLASANVSLQAPQRTTAATWDVAARSIVVLVAP